MEKTCALILAAGDGKRMKSEEPKVLSKVVFTPMIKWVIDSLHEADINSIGVVCGYKHETLKNYLKTISSNKHTYETFIQHERKGTAHAVITAEEFLNKNIGNDILVLAGDAPFIDSKTIKESYEFHKINNNIATIISARVSNPFGYGRIVRNLVDGTITSIVEQKDADESTRTITEVNSGAYWFNVLELRNVIYNISNDNAQNEYYLPDAIRLLLDKGFKVDAFVADSEETILGANDRVQLSQLNNIARDRILEFHLNNGVDIPFKDGVIIGKDVVIEKTACILPNSIIIGNTCIGDNCTIGPNVLIENCRVENDVNLSCINSKYKTFLAEETVPPFSAL